MWSLVVQCTSGTVEDSKHIHVVQVDGTKQTHWDWVKNREDVKFGMGHVEEAQQRN